VSPGKWEELDVKGIQQLFEAAGLPRPEWEVPRRHTRDPAHRRKRH
jgi:hypothetical protein